MGYDISNVLEGVCDMLGYIKTDTQELRVREHHYYRALYCGLCHRMGKCTGNCSRMTLVCTHRNSC